jgi:hypothetical protein
MFSKVLTHAGHTRTFSIDVLFSGWELRVAEDSEIVRRMSYTDWHRVERAISAIEREVSTLEAQGWQPVGTGATAT